MTATYRKEVSLWREVVFRYEKSVSKSPVRDGRVPLAEAAVEVGSDYDLPVDAAARLRIEPGK